LCYGEVTSAALAGAADLPFLLLVLVLGIVAETVTANGLEHAQGPVLPDDGTLPVTVLASERNKPARRLGAGHASGAGRGARGRHQAGPGV
jgi:hypothetical protein